MLHPWWIVALLVSWIAVGALSWRISAGYTERQWQAREARINAQAAQKIRQAYDRVLEIERKAAQHSAAIAERYEKEVADALQDRDRVLRQLRDARRRLSIPARCSAPGRDSAGEASSGSSGGDEGARAELSEEAARFLVGLASEADEVVLQLRAAQKLIAEDREICR